MSGAIKSVADLIATGLVRDDAALETVAQKYAAGITPDVLALIDKTDPDNPIARQFVASPQELVSMPEERVDPIGDLSHSSVEGIVHRYPDRVLLKAVDVCPVCCQFCFRRKMVGPQGLRTMMISRCWRR